MSPLCHWPSRLIRLEKPIARDSNTVTLACEAAFSRTGDDQMTHFESKLLRLVALGILILGNVGFMIAQPTASGAFGAIALVCMLFVACELVIDAAKWLWPRAEERWTKDWRHQLAAPLRAQGEPSKSN
ncbi:hypothetical protein AYO47_09885 [Planctomyces sp. SCGC AG-212-M04]|nr:hypothetical protein AYO47_09885 [Planctomyces sp. SCGC AG-212-M04]